MIEKLQDYNLNKYPSRGYRDREGWDKINELIDWANNRNEGKSVEPNTCGEVIQHTVMGPITCSNKLPCFLHSSAPIKLEEGEVVKL
jgi:hypothetical protein